MAPLDRHTGDGQRPGLWRALLRVGLTIGAVGLCAAVLVALVVMI